MVQAVILSMVLMLGSCSQVLDFIKPSAGLSVDTEIVAGDKEQTVHTEIGETTNTADTLSIQNINTDYWMVLLALLGWVLPTPRTMFRYIRGKIPFL